MSCWVHNSTTPFGLCELRPQQNYLLTTRQNYNYSKIVKFQLGESPLRITATITFDFDIENLPLDEIIDIITHGEFFPENVMECEINK